MTRWILIEVKGGPKRGVRDSARAATHDLLAYRRAFGPALAERPGPYGLGYAWGAGLTPSADAEIVLCTPDTLTQALGLLLSRLEDGPRPARRRPALRVLKECTCARESSLTRQALLPRLNPPEGRVQAARLDELVVGAGLAQPARLQHVDPIGVPDGAQPVGDHERRPPLRDRLQRALDRRLGLVVDRARRLVQDQDRRVAERWLGRSRGAGAGLPRASGRARPRGCRSRGAGRR